VPWQLTQLARRAQRLLGLGPAGGGHSSGGDPVVELAARVRAGLRPDEQTAYDTWVRDRPEAATVLARVLAGAGWLAPVAELAEAWDGWDHDVRVAVADPRRLATEARQTDPTTCGSASLVLLAAAGDPLLAAWLTCGWLPRERAGERSQRPVELSGASDRALVVLAERPAHERFGVLQQVVKRRTNARALGPLPWPSSLGTPPWGAARVARFPGVTRWIPRMVDDTDAAELAGTLTQVRDGVRRGVPVPLYAGGDTSSGWQTALPRHVVLAVGTTPTGLEVFEPSSGALLELADDGSGPRAALGGWSHLAWAVLPG
jgi:hypothetical protein